MASSDSHQLANQLRYWLALKHIPRLSTPASLALVEKFGISNLFEENIDRDLLGLSAKQYQALTSPNWRKVDDICQAIKDDQQYTITYSDKRYPEQLKHIYDPPLVLFAKGNIDLLQTMQLAIVGSRNMSIDGKSTTKSLAGDLAQLGITITSGLALGVDGIAHQAALACNGATIAVVATGLDIIYPSRHKPIAKKMLEQNGLIVSEFVPGTPAKPGHFPKRNRIISGLSAGVLVVEAAIKSGSLVTARCALEQGREVFAVPGNIRNPNVAGCHWLIKQGAALTETVLDIIEQVPHFAEFELNLNKIKDKESGSKKNNVQDLSNDPLLASVGYEITPVDKVVSRSKLPIDVVLTRLTMLELRGLVTAVPGGYLKIK